MLDKAFFLLGLNVISVPGSGQDNQLVADPGFDDPGYWQTDAGWAVADSKANADAAFGSIWHPDEGIVAGKTYRWEFTVEGRTAGSVRVFIGDAYGFAYSVDGTFSGELVAQSSTTFALTSPNGFIGKVDNFTVTLIDP